jgi:hypothetical protein
MKADVVLVGGSREEMTAVADACRSVGLEARVQTENPLAGDPHIWILFVTVPIDAFFAALATELGKDAYKKLKGFAAKLRGSHRGEEGVIRLRDVSRRVEILLEADVPDIAFEQLVQEHEQLRTGSYRFSSRTKRWEVRRAPR